MPNIDLDVLSIVFSVLNLILFAVLAVIVYKLVKRFALFKKQLPEEKAEHATKI